MGQVGVLLLAGGQGTRLGVPYPKGMYDIGLPSRKTLYQIQMERVLRLQQMAEDKFGRKGGHEKNGVSGNGDSDGSGRVAMYIMTSEHTKTPTASFLEEHAHFGLAGEDVVLFEQPMIPCLDSNGKVILEAPDRVARAPDGNGGLYGALRDEGVLDDMERRGIRYESQDFYCSDKF